MGAGAVWNKASPRASRWRHLVFLAHLWACSPFLLVWVFRPDLLAIWSAPEIAAPLRILWIAILAYLVVRTFLAWLDPPWLRWDYIFPIVDMFWASAAVYLRREPDTSLLLMYFLPIAEAASTLNVSWAALVGVLSVAGGIAATWNQVSGSLFSLVFRCFFLVLMASLLTWLARLGAEVRAQLSAAAERDRIALEMHDGVQGLLMSIAAQTELARRVGPRDAALAVEIAGETHQLARQAADELRYLVGRLRQPAAGSGFLSALRTHVEHVCRRHELQPAFTTTGTVAPLPPETEHALFRIVQEALNNVVKHSGATDVTLELAFEPDQVRCVVRDNGVGLCSSPLLERSGGLGSGIAGMQERARLLGGAVRVEGPPGAGTTVTVVLPCAARRLRAPAATETA